MLAKHHLRICLATIAIISYPVLAGSNVTGGVIQFRGQVVEPPCESSVDNQHVVMSCLQNGQIKTSRFTLQQLTKTSPQLAATANVNMHYLDKDKKLAIMTIEYR